MTMKFDRTTYDTTVLEWTPSTNYSKDDIITYNGNPFKAIQDFQTGVTFSVEFLAVVPAEEFTNANDRTWAYYQPGAGLVGRDLTQIFSGLEFPGVQIIGPRIESGFDSFGWDDEGFDFAPITAIDDTIDGGALTTNFCKDCVQERWISMAVHLLIHTTAMLQRNYYRVVYLIHWIYRCIH